MTPFAQTSTYILSLGVLVAGILVLCLFGIFILHQLKYKNNFTKTIQRFISQNIVVIGLVLSIGAFLGSLFYSNIIGFIPCELCWWQRIFIYPQVILFAVALYYKKAKLSIESLLTTSIVMSCIGGAIALYHSYGQLIDSSVLPACEVQGVSCSKLYFLTFGYITIPTMSLTLFLLLLFVVLIHKVDEK